MKNVFRGGLRSLIPNRNVQDADDVLDELEDDELDQEEETEEIKPGRKLPIALEEEEEEPGGEVKGAEVEDMIEEEEEEVWKAPVAPKVTPLQIDFDDDEGPDLKLQQAKKQKPKESVKARLNDLEVKIEERPRQKKLVVADSESIPEQAVVNEGTVQPKEIKPVRVAAGKPASGNIWDKHEGDVQHVKVDDIGINPNQPRRRFDKVDMEELKSSIAQHGILQPLVVRRTDDGFELVAGERRLRAAKDLGWEKVPCVIRKDVTSGASRLELALIENIQREDLNPVEEALAYKQLNEEYGMTHEEIGERVGRSRVGITNIIRVLQLPEEIQRGLIDNKISPGHAKAILMIPDEEKQLRFYRHLVEEGLTVRKAETRARRIQRTMRLDDPMRRKRKGRTAFDMKYSGVLEDRYGFDAKVRFDEHKNRYEVVFRCFNKEEIDQLLGRLTGTESLPEESQDRDVIDADED